MNYYFQLKNSALVEFNPELCKLYIRQLNSEPEEITLARSDARILEFLLIEPGAICSREAIMSFAWSDRVVSAGSLNQSIFMLRNILGDSKNHDVLITVPRHGYRFNSDCLVAPADATEAHAEALALEPEPAPVSEPDTKQGIAIHVWLGYLAATLLVLACACRLYSWYEPVNELKVISFTQGELSITAVGKTQPEVDALKSDLLRSGLLEQTLNGQIFISRSDARISMSCIRKSGSAYNLDFYSRDASFISMLEKCLGGEQ